MMQNGRISPRSIFLEIIKNTSKRSRPGGPHPSHEGGGAPAPLGAPPTSWAPWSSSDLNSNSIYLLSGRKKIREKDSSCFTIRSRL